MHECVQISSEKIQYFYITEKTNNYPSFILFCFIAYCKGKYVKREKKEFL